MRLVIPRVVFHIDFDYFYAQCEEMRRPELRAKPVVVCVFSDRGGDSGAVATANYHARKFGVKSGIPIKFAKKRLADSHDAVFLPTDFDYYSEVSDSAMAVIRGYADVFEYVGRDEAYLDVTKRTGGDYASASHLAQQLKNALRSSVRLSSTVGVSANKLVAKIASGYRKPDGLTVVPPDGISSFLDPLPIKEIPGIGSKTEQIFRDLGMSTISDLKRLDVFALNGMFGRKTGTYIYNAARGIDESPVSPRGDPVQYSRIVTLKQDSKDYDYLSRDLEALCEDVHRAVVRDDLVFKSIGIQFVQDDLSSRTKSRTLKNHTANLDELKRTALLLLRELLADQRLQVRRLGVKVADFIETSGQADITRFF